MNFMEPVANACPWEIPALEFRSAAPAVVSVEVPRAKRPATPAEVRAGACRDNTSANHANYPRRKVADDVNDLCSEGDPRQRLVRAEDGGPDWPQLIPSVFTMKVISAYVCPV